MNKFKLNKTAKFWSATAMSVATCLGLLFLSGCQESGGGAPVDKHPVPVVTDATFEQDVLKANMPVLVDFWAPWCGPCRRMSPVVGEVSAELKGKINVFKMNVDENPTTAQKYQIRGIPSLFLFEKGELIEQIVGAVPKETLVQAIQKHVK